MKYIILLIITLSIISCSKDEGEFVEKTKQKEATRTLTDSDIKNYFESQLDQYTVLYPNKDYYNLEELDKMELAEFKIKIWEIWKSANKKRITKSKLESEITKKGSLLTWNIPLEEKMKIKLFTKGLKPESKYPLIINLHGGGAYPNVNGPWKSEINEGQWYGAMEILEENNDGPALCCIPRMADDRRGNWHYKPQIVTFKKIIQLAIINDIIDPDKVYIVGGSQGGYGVISLSKFMPDYFAGASAYAAADNPDMLQNLRNLSFRMRVGEKDYGHGRVHHAYKWMDSLKELYEKDNKYFDHEIIVEKSKGHSEIDYSKMTPWLKKCTRNIKVNKVSYTYHNIVNGNEKFGMYSDGVYFLDFRSLKRESNADKIAFDVTKSENQIIITTNKIKGNVTGEIGIYLEGYIDKNITVKLNGKKIDYKIYKNSKGIMAESLALWGDPKRIYGTKLTFKIENK